MSLRLAWDEDCPAEVRASMEPHIERYRDLLPGWLAELRLGFDDNDQAGIAYTRCNPEYRWARIMTCGTWLKENNADRDEVLLHEMVHIPLQPLVVVFEDLLATLDDTPAPIKAWARDQLRRALEGACTDVTEMLMAVLA